MSKFKVGDLFCTIEERVYDKPFIWFIVERVTEDEYICIGINNNHNKQNGTIVSSLYGDYKMLGNMSVSMAKLLYG